MNNKEDSKKKKIDIVVKIVLIIIIIILLLHNCYLIRKEREMINKIPTGNVDIIEITCDKEDTCKPTDGKKPNNTNKNNDTEPVNGEDDDIDEDSELIVYDKDVTWHKETVAKIFANSMYEVKDIIAPESHNTYKFIVKNKTKYNLKYDINFVEDNPYKINMKFKLKKNDTYIIDHYVSVDKLNVATSLLDIKADDIYYLEWKWFSSSNDTEIGLNPDSKYSLKIDIKAESIDE